MTLVHRFECGYENSVPSKVAQAYNQGNLKTMPACHKCGVVLT